MHIVSYNDTPYRINRGDWMLSIPLVADVMVSQPVSLSDSRYSEVYVQGEPWAIKLKNSLSEHTDHDFKLMSNPVAGDIALHTSLNLQEGMRNFKIINAEGRILFHSNRYCQPGEPFNIALPDGWVPGIYWLQIESASSRQSIRFISIR
jgi:hypothetical protein